MIYEKRIEPVKGDDLNLVFHKDLDSEVFIITLPGSNFFKEVEVSLCEVCILRYILMPVCCCVYFASSVQAQNSLQFTFLEYVVSLVLV